ncbi:MAG: hypothetical protein HY784_03725 [Chloroflexi bacterium]|nr:hypothetical protein [Chloroflexota bacterium]
MLWQQAGRWPGLWLLAPVPLAPLLIVPLRRLWPAPFLLIPALILPGEHNLDLRLSLPPGRWTQPVTSVSCSGSILPLPDRDTAWCADEAGQQVFRFRLSTGRVTARIPLPEAARVLAAGPEEAWVAQNPLRGLIRVRAGGQRSPLRINFPAQGALDQAGRLWVIAQSDTLFVADPELRALRQADGLLSNTANAVKLAPDTFGNRGLAPDGTVWVGSIGGASYLPPGGRWGTLSRREGLPGPVRDLAFAPDGTVWFLWEYAGGSAGWGASGWRGGVWQHLPLGKATGLALPAGQGDSLAVDGHGRLWFTAVNYARGESLLGVVAPDTGDMQLYRLGPFVLRNGVSLPAVSGVLRDGTGGIVLYFAGDPPWWLHWRS